MQYTLPATTSFVSFQEAFNTSHAKAKEEAWARFTKHWSQPRGYERLINFLDHHPQGRDFPSMFPYPDLAGKLCIRVKNTTPTNIKALDHALREFGYSTYSAPGTIPSLYFVAEDDFNGPEVWVTAYEFSPDFHDPNEGV